MPGHSLSTKTKKPRKSGYSQGAACRRDFGLLLGDRLSVLVGSSGVRTTRRRWPCLTFTTSGFLTSLFDDLPPAARAHGVTGPWPQQRHGMPVQAPERLGEGVLPPAGPPGGTGCFRGSHAGPPREAGGGRAPARGPAPACSPPIPPPYPRPGPR